MSAPTEKQAEILRLLARSPQPTIREMCDQLGLLSTNTVAEQLDALERKGLATRASSSSGSRARSIAITDAGLEAIGAQRCPTCGQVDAPPAGGAP